MSTKTNSSADSRRSVSKLVYFEETKDVHSALAREKEIKKWAPGEEGCFSGRRESGVEGAFGSGEGFLPAVEMTAREGIPFPNYRDITHRDVANFRLAS